MERARFVTLVRRALRDVPPPFKEHLRQVDIVQNNTLFRLYGGPFASRADAEAVARQMQASGGAMPIIVQR